MRAPQDNLKLLMKLQRIQKHGGEHSVQPPPAKIKSTASLNRNQEQRKIEEQNLKFLKRLQAIKSSGVSTSPTPTTAAHTRKVVATKPKPAAGLGDKPKWVDLEGGMYL
jgi:hypothetical protein